ncbi:MAG: hypothetical protein J5851_02625, partial [Oscillospiraceae bacterium]|nr:hypothetical protein [Oscillospiraceae bacterium]
MHTKRIPALLWSVVLALSAMPQGAVLAEEPQLHLASSATDAPRFLMTAADTAPTAEETELPERYDLRSAGLVSAVKNQNPYGTCWAFGATAALENALIAEDAHIDLSEWYLAQRKGHGVTSPFNHMEREDYINDGGTMQEVIAMLTNWVGPVKEADCPYGGAAPDFDKSLQAVRQEAAYHMTDFHYFDKGGVMEMSPSMREQLKQAIFDGHAISFSLGSNAFVDENIYNYEHDTYYMPPDFWDTFDYEHLNYEDYIGHAMCIIGWDDTIPADSFSQKPSQDGAWLVKNSWGLDFGDDGYFWLSYDDSFADELIYYDLEDAACHDMLYAHDEFGCNGAFSLSDKVTDTVAYGANIYTAEEDGFLTDVMVDCIVPDDDCQVTIYTGLQNAADPTSGTAMATAAGSKLHVGYQTLPLSEAVPVQQGERFSVVVQYTGEKGGHLPCELGFFFDTGSNANRSKALAQELGVQLGVMLRFDLLSKEFQAGQSFFSADGKTWNDTYKQGKIKTQYGDTARVGNFCVKALGVKRGKVLFSDYHEALPYGTEIALSTPEQADLYYAVNGGSYQKYTAPIPFTGEMTVSAYADTDKKTVTTRHYTQRRAELSSLLFHTDDESRYLELDSEIDCTSGVEDTYIVPISTGKITINGVECISGEHYPLQTEKEETLTITVEQEDCLSTTYQLHVTNARFRPITNGIMIGYDPAVSEDPLAFEFRDGNGRIKRIEDGTICPFTYERNDAGAYVFHFEDHDTTVGFEMSAYYADDDLADCGMWLTPEGRDAVYVMFKADRVLEEYPVFSKAETFSAIGALYEESTGTKPDKVQFNAAEGCAEVYVDGKAVKSYYFENDGTMWDPDAEESVIYGAVTGDTNADKTINASDAAVILIEAA